MRVSNSQIQCYKSCRRLYELQYVYGVKALSTSQAIETGLGYHAKIEHLFQTGEVLMDENPKTSAMAQAFANHILPELHPVAQEEWFEYGSGSNAVLGRIDARNEDGAIIEHKTTSGDIDEMYWYTRYTDEQLMTYMLAYGTNKAYYTVCKTPSIRQKQNETEEQFFKRCVEWYDEDTESKIAMRLIEIPEEQLREFEYMQKATIEEMKNCKLFYRNTGYCNKWNKLCEYAPICQQYDPEQNYVGFEKKEVRGND